MNKKGKWKEMDDNIMKYLLRNELDNIY